MMIMKDNLYKEIENSLSEFEQINIYLSNLKPENNRFSKLKLGAAHSKKTDCLLTAMKFADFLYKYYNEQYSFSPQILKEIEQYKGMIETITVSNNEVIYPKEYSDFISDLESKMSKN